MICNICGKDQEGCRVEIVTGTNIETKTLRYGTGTSTTQTFSNFKPMEFWFCQECWRALKRKNDKTELIITGISSVICSILVIVGFVSNSNLGVFAFILGLISLIAFIYDLYKLIGELRLNKPLSRVLGLNEGLMKYKMLLFVALTLIFLLSFG